MFSLPVFRLLQVPFLLLKLSVKQNWVDYRDTVPGSLLLPPSQPFQILDPLLPFCLWTEKSSYPVFEERGPENITIRLAGTFSRCSAVSVSRVHLVLNTCCAYYLCLSCHFIGFQCSACDDWRHLCQGMQIIDLHVWNLFNNGVLYLQQDSTQPHVL